MKTILPLLLLLFTRASAQNAVPLNIGDRAPELHYSRLLKGENITALTGNQIYVLEFWATWCGPCRAAMPHLTQLQKKYTGAVSIIGVNVGERLSAGQKYESVLPAVSKFVKGNAANMDYTIIADNNELHMNTKWLKAADEKSIPSTFIVQHHKILWIGPPDQLDTILPRILEGKFDVAAMRTSRLNRKSAENSKEVLAIQAAINPVSAALADQAYTKAIELIDKAEAQLPQYKPAFVYMRFQALLAIEPAKAIELAETWQKTGAITAAMALSEAAKRDDLGKEVYRWFAMNFEQANTSVNALNLHALATCYAKSGDFSSAVSWEEKAIGAARTALQQNTLPGYISADTVVQYTKALLAYRKKIGYPKETSDTPQVTLKGNIKGLGNNELTFYYYEGSESKWAKVKASENRFVWTANVKHPQKVTVMFPGNAIPLYVEPGKMELRGNILALNEVKLTGSKIQDEANAFQRLLLPFSNQDKPLYQKYGKAGKEEQRQLLEQMEMIRQQKRALMISYIRQHPDSWFSLSLVTDRLGMGDYNDVQPMYEKLGETIKKSAEGSRLTEQLTVLKRSAIGAEVLNFEQNDTEGNAVNFTWFRGKYVFIDFWASWCGPCRAENPNVLKAYNKYKDQNFTVVGISLDDKADKWKKAIKDDAMPWTQLSDLKGWKNEVSQYYGINSIPSTLLVDPGGKIIAKDLRGESLNKKLEELFNLPEIR